MFKQPPAAFIGRTAEPGALAPLRSLSEAIFFDLFDRRFKSYDVWDQLRRG
jgi:hypothetical protein